MGRRPILSFIEIHTAPLPINYRGHALFAARIRSLATGAVAPLTPDPEAEVTQRRQTNEEADDAVEAFDGDGRDES